MRKDRDVTGFIGSSLEGFEDLVDEIGSVYEIVKNGVSLLSMSDKLGNHFKSRHTIFQEVF